MAFSSQASFVLSKSFSSSSLGSRTSLRTQVRGSTEKPTTLQTAYESSSSRRDFCMFIASVGAWGLGAATAGALVRGNAPPKGYGLGKNFEKAAECTQVTECQEIGRQKEEEEFGSTKEITFKMTADGVRYKDMTEGNAKDGVAKPGSTLKLKYRVMRSGKRANDGLSGEASTIFSLGYGEDDGPKDAVLTAPLGQGRFVKAIEEGLEGLAVGGKRRIQVRPEQGFGWKKPGKCAEQIQVVGVAAGLPMGGAENNGTCLDEALLPQPQDFAAKRRFSRRFDESLIVELELVGVE